MNHFCHFSHITKDLLRLNEARSLRWEVLQLRGKAGITGCSLTRVPPPFFDPCCGKGVPGSEPCPCPCPPVFLQIIEAELRSTKRWELTAEGEEIAREGSHEARVFRGVPPEGLPQSELMVGV